MSSHSNVQSAPELSIKQTSWVGGGGGGNCILQRLELKVDMQWKQFNSIYTSIWPFLIPIELNDPRVSRGRLNQSATLNGCYIVDDKVPH